MEASSSETFGALLKQLRTARGWTQVELAEQSGVSAYSISNLERGTPRRPRHATVHLLATALDLVPKEREIFVARGRGYRTSADGRLVDQSTSRLATERRLSSLPLPPTPLIGREGELVGALACLARPQVRLLTLIGPAGSGKTHLSLDVARQAAPRYPDGVGFVSLAPLRDPDLLVSAIAGALGLQEHGHEPMRETLMSYLSTKHLLLVLDNFEHLGAAAPQIAMLLETCPQLQVLVTSRATLRLRGEQELPVPPLALPNLEALPALADLAHVPAVDLFLQRASAAAPSFGLTQANAATLAAICCQLDGLPLAIELAAPLVQLLTPPMLLQRLAHRLDLLVDGPADLPKRQRSLRATLVWSYDLLSPPERAMFRRLSVFVGGATLEAVEAVCSAGNAVPTNMVVTVLARLCASSLIVQHETPEDRARFSQLETIREYGREQLLAAREAPSVERAHAEYFLALAEAAFTGLQGPDQASWLDRLEQEHANLRAALRWALENEEVETGLRLAALLWRFWDARGYGREGRQWLEAFLVLADRLPDTYSSATLAMAHSSTGILAWRVGDYACAEQHHTTALQLHQHLGDLQRIASDFNNLASIAYDRGDYRHAWELLEACLAIHRRVGDTRSTALVLKNLGAVAFDQGDLTHAMDSIQESLHMRRQTGDQRGIASSLVAVGEIAREQGCYGQAKESFTEALRLYRRLRERLGTAVTIHGIASIDYDTGNFGRARRRCQFSLSTLQEIDKGFYLAQVQVTLGKIAYASGDYATARVHFEDSITWRQKLSDHLRIAESLFWLALIEDAQADTYQALTYLRESVTIFQSHQTTHNVPTCLEALGLVLHGQGQRAPARSTLEMATALRSANGTPQPPAERSLLAHRLAGDATWLTGSQRDPRPSGALTTSLEGMLAQAQSFIAAALDHLPGSTVAPLHRNGAVAGPANVPA